MKRRSVYLLIAVLAVGSAALGQDDEVSAKCPTNLPYTTAVKLFEDSCYQFVSQEKYWQQARDYCLMHGGRLVKIDDPQTNEFIINRLNELWWRNQGVWIGLHDITSEMKWQWTGYQLYENEPVRWTNWARGHPGAFLHSRRDCVRMVREGGRWRWHETFCSTLRWHYRFICEYRANASRHAGSANRRILQRPVPANHDSPAADNSMLEGFNDDEEPLWKSGGVRAPVAVQSSEQKADGGDNSKKYGSGIIAGAIGCILIGSVVIIVVFVLYRRRRRLRRESYGSSTVSKGKDPYDEDKMADPKSVRPRAVANIYVTTDVRGHATTRLASRPKPDVIVDSDSYEEEDYDDDNEELKRESQEEISANMATEGENADSRVAYDKLKSSNTYSEIPENDEYPENSHIYEALDDVRK